MAAGRLAPPARRVLSSHRVTRVIPQIALRPLNPAYDAATITLSSGDAKTIGRSPAADITIDDASLSRMHLRVVMQDTGTLLVEDLNSTNGIYVRAKRVRRRMLNDGDVVQIGQHEVMYFDERLSRTRAMPGEIEDDAVPLVQGKQAGQDTEDDDEPAAPMPIRADRK